MTKRMRELLAARNEAVETVRAHMDKRDAEAAEKAMAEVRSVDKMIAMQKELEAEEEREFEAARPAAERKDEQELANEYERVFLKAVRNQRMSADDMSTMRAYRREILNVMHEGGVSGDPDGDSSIVVPVDVETRINELIRQETNLAQYVRREQVSTLSGTRVLEKDARHTPFVAIDEYAEVQEVDGPQFVPVSYEIKKRGGFLPLTSELLEDNDANLLQYVINWLGQKVPATYNSLILPILDALTAVDVTSVDDVKHLKNIEIIPAFANRGTWFTNQDGYNWLDTQKDDSGRYLLQDDIANAGGKLLQSRPVIVVENELWPSVVDTNTKAPLVFGDLEEYIVHFERKGYELASTREGGEAWRRDSLEMRALMRDDFVTWDDKAVVRGDIVIS